MTMAPGAGCACFCVACFPGAKPSANLNTLVMIQAAEDATSLPSAAAVPEDRPGTSALPTPRPKEYGEAVASVRTVAKVAVMDAVRGALITGLSEDVAFIQKRLEEAAEYQRLASLMDGSAAAESKAAAAPAVVTAAGSLAPTTILSGVEHEDQSFGSLDLKGPADWEMARWESVKDLTGLAAAKDLTDGLGLSFSGGLPVRSDRGLTLMSLFHCSRRRGSEGYDIRGILDSPELEIVNQHMKEANSAILPEGPMDRSFSCRCPSRLCA